MVGSFQGSKMKYQPIPTSQEDSISKTIQSSATPHQQTTRCTKVWIFLSLNLIALFLIFLFALNNPAFERPSFDTSGYLCAPNGLSIEAAQARGCEFDWMSFRWQQKDRFDDDNVRLIQEFNDKGPWKRYADAEGKRVMGAEEIMVTTELWLTRREHLVHCAFALRQSFNYMARGNDPPFNAHHVLHCATTLLDAIYESPPPDMDNLTIHAVPFPKEKEIVCPPAEDSVGF